MVNQLLNMINHAITVIALRLSGTFARTLILRKVKPLAFIGKTLKKYVKNSLKYRTFMKTHLNYISIQIKRLIPDACAAFVVLCMSLTRHFFFSDNLNLQNLKDVCDSKLMGWAT